MEKEFKTIQARNSSLFTARAKKTQLDFLNLSTKLNSSLTNRTDHSRAKKIQKKPNYLKAIIGRMRSKILMRRAINEEHRASNLALDQTRKMKTRQIEELSDPGDAPKY